MINADKDEYGAHSIEETHREDSVYMVMRRQVIMLEKFTTNFTSIYLSNNHFQGEIPEVLGNFKSLQVLNLCHNVLTGNIPSSLGNSIALKSLDLCSNELDRRIPEQLKSLTYLAVFKVSHNKLWGHIPHTFLNGSLLTSLTSATINWKGNCQDLWLIVVSWRLSI